MEMLNQNNQLNGYLEEQAFITTSSKINNSIDLKKQLLDALNIYASYGMTTLQKVI